MDRYMSASYAGNQAVQTRLRSGLCAPPYNRTEMLDLAPWLLLVRDTVCSGNIKYPVYGQSPGLLRLHPFTLKETASIPSTSESGERYPTHKELLPWAQIRTARLRYPRTGAITSRQLPLVVGGKMRPNTIA